MIDWGDLMANGLWISGCALGLTALSYAVWETTKYHEKIINRLSQRPLLMALNLAGLLFSTGMAVSSSQSFEMFLWTLLAVLFFIGIIVGYKK